jgi:hypothetical protein
MAKMVRKPMKVAMSARPLMVSMKPLPPPHRTETQKAEATQAQGGGLWHVVRIRPDLHRNVTGKTKSRGGSGGYE